MSFFACSDPRTSFNLFHPEKLLSTQIRYADEVERVIGILDKELAKLSSGWLVGDKFTYVDLAFVMWDEQVGKFMSMAPFTGGEWDAGRIPSWKKWHKRMLQRPVVKRDLQQKLIYWQ